MKAILAIKVNYCPIKKLALINFEKKPDTIYRGLELQYFDGSTYGKGYRVIAYRNDNYVDVYDDYSLTYKEDEKFDVTINGLNKHIQTQFHNVTFEKTNGMVAICFTFIDLLNREISVSIVEHTKRKSTPMNLLAPIGIGSRKPSFLPVFFMYDFDFVRKSKTDVSITIDGNEISMDKFAIPMNMQFRYYSRYSTNCQLIEFINTDYNKLIEVDLDDKLSYKEENVIYYFNNEAQLKSINVDTGNSAVKVEFEPALAFNNNDKCYEGSFKIIPEESMGFIEGEFEISNDTGTQDYKLSLTPCYGWTAVPNSKITRMLLTPKSDFCCWSKNYSLQEDLSLEEMTVIGKWTNGNVKGFSITNGSSNK